MKAQVHLFLLGMLLSVLMLGGCEKETGPTKLEGNSWVAQKLKDEATGRLKAPASYLLTFSDSSSFSIGLDVNDCFGEYEAGATAGEISIEYPACTKVCCDSEFSEQMLDILSRATHYAIQNDELTFEAGSSWVRFSRE